MYKIYFLFFIKQRIVQQKLSCNFNENFERYDVKKYTHNKSYSPKCLWAKRLCGPRKNSRYEWNHYENDSIYK